MLIPGHLSALGLGEIVVDSTLSQPLQARIDFIGAHPEDLKGMRIGLPSAEVFDRVDIPRSRFLTQLEFQPELLPDGRMAIRVFSRVPVFEPSVTFLVEVIWAKGRLLREYTALLDTLPAERIQRHERLKTTPAVAESTIEAEIVAAVTRLIALLKQQVSNSVLGVVTLATSAVLVVLVILAVAGSLYSWHRKRSAGRIEAAVASREIRFPEESFNDNSEGSGALPLTGGVDTKLDIGRAFIGMGDTDAAREVLLEVINEGDASQIKAAQNLMDKL